MKKIDRYLFFGFIPPFIVTFFIALFVLIMQFLWTYIDDIIGKGTGLWLITELIFYLSISLFPMALPIAVLISSVMLMGNLAERYELASIKSAGVSLLRTMLPLVLLCSFIASFSYLCSNYIIPYANLKFKSRLYDIRKSKPTLSLEEGIFNYDFKGFVIHIGKKLEDNKSIEDVLIYDHNSYHKGRLSQITAKTGEMFTTDDKQFFVMNLYDGYQYQETEDKKGKDKTYPFMRTKFKEWNKVFDLSQFEMKRTNEELFQSHQTMLSIAQLRVAIDSIDLKLQGKREEFSTYMNNYFQDRKKFVKIDKKKEGKTETAKKGTENKNQKGQKTEDKKEAKKTAQPKKVVNKAPPKNTSFSKQQLDKQKIKKRVHTPKIIKQDIQQELYCYDSFLETLPVKEHRKISTKSESTIRNIYGQLQSTNRSLKGINYKRIKHVYELHLKYSMAIVCIVFLFIGAPMGAIVRKGGFGYPILIAIIFFIFFMVMTIFCKKFAEQQVMSANLAAWIPCLTLLPIGMILTFQAMNDRKFVSMDRITAFVKSVIAFFKKDKEQNTNE